MTTRSAAEASASSGSKSSGEPSTWCSPTPRAWQPLDQTYRRCRLHRFPFGVCYRIDTAANQIVIVAVMHLSERPDA